MIGNARTSGKYPDWLHVLKHIRPTERESDLYQVSRLKLRYVLGAFPQLASLVSYFLPTSFPLNPFWHLKCTLDNTEMKICLVYFCRGQTNRQKLGYSNNFYRQLV